MPGLLSIKKDHNKKLALKDIYSTIILNDVINRHPIRKPKLFKTFTNYIMSTSGEVFSSNSIYGSLKNYAQKTSKDTIENYMEFLEESYFIHKIKREDLIGKKIFKIYEKYYLTDHGFHHAFIANNSTKISHILENMMFVELLRRGYDVKVGQVKKREVDFVCRKEDKTVYIQVAYVLEQQKTIDREFTPLLEIPDKYDSYVLSMDEFDMSQKGVNIETLLIFYCLMKFN